MSATTSPDSLPSPEPDEPSDVTVAIEAARALWENGDKEEALRWFSRAAEAAEQAGNDRRALDLARAVADLKDGLAASRAPAVETPEAAPRRSVPPPLPTPAVATTPAAPAQPAASTAPKLVTRPPPAPSSRKSVAPTPPSMRPRPPEATTAKSFTGAQQADTPAAPQHAPSAAPQAAKAPPATKISPPAEAAPAAKAAPVAKATPQNDAGKSERLRVSVKSSVRDPNLLLVRVLGAGQAVPSGCHEAFLSPADSGIDLRSPGE